MSWKERQRNELRDQLLITSLRLFRAQGFEETTVQQIVDEVGVGKGTFFNHFPTKVRVLIEWYQDLTLEALAEVEARRHATARDALQALAAALASRTAAQPDLWAMKSAHAFVDASLRAEERDLDSVLDGYCMRHLAAGKARGEIDPGVDEPLFAGIFNALLTGTGHSWVVSGHRFDLEETLAARIEFLFDAASRRRDDTGERAGDRS